MIRCPVCTGRFPPLPCEIPNPPHLGPGCGMLPVHPHPRLTVAAGEMLAMPEYPVTVQDTLDGPPEVLTTRAACIGSRSHGRPE